MILHSRHYLVVAMFGLALVPGTLRAPAFDQSATSIVVNSLDDTSNVGTVCTLRDAIDNAATNKPIHPNCASGSGDTTITFSVSGTITLKKTLPNIYGNSAITIDGGNTIVLSGNKKVAMIKVSDHTAPFTLQNMTLQDGTSGPNGGAIEIVGGTVTIDHCIFTNNTASNSGGAIQLDDGTVSVTNSTFSSNAVPNNGAAINFVKGKLTIDHSTFTANIGKFFGGAIGVGGGGNIAAATLAIDHSTFSGNSSSRGGAIANSGTLTIANSTFVNNTSDCCGGAISVLQTPMTITNTTFIGNKSYSGSAFGTGGPLTMTNSTLVGNISTSAGGGAFQGGKLVTIRNSIVANNKGGNKSSNCAVGTNISTNGAAFNLSDDKSCFGFTESASLNLDMLADNGGPTQTIGLLAASAALNAGDPAFCPPTDQRGQPRPAGAACSIGAFEGIVTPNPAATMAATQAATAAGAS